jgi:hypothetical protein
MELDDPVEDAKGVEYERQAIVAYMSHAKYRHLASIPCPLQGARRARARAPGPS